MRWTRLISVEFNDKPETKTLPNWILRNMRSLNSKLVRTLKRQELCEPSRSVS